MTIRRIDDIVSDRRVAEQKKQIDRIRNTFENVLDDLKVRRERKKELVKKKPLNRFLKIVGMVLGIAWGLILLLGTAWLLKVLVLGVLG